MSTGYEAWMRRLEVAFATSKKPALERTQSQEWRAAVYGDGVVKITRRVVLVFVGSMAEGG